MPVNDYNQDKIWNPVDLTSEIIVNLYRFGSETIPEYFGDHIREVRPQLTVQISAADYMLTGPGRDLSPLAPSFISRV